MHIHGSEAHINKYAPGTIENTLHHLDASTTGDVFNLPLHISQSIRVVK